MSSHDLSDASLPSVLAGAAGATGTAVVATAMGAAAKSANDLFSKWEGVLSLHRQTGPACTHR